MIDHQARRNRREHRFSAVRRDAPRYELDLFQSRRAAAHIRGLGIPGFGRLAPWYVYGQEQTGPRLGRRECQQYFSDTFRSFRGLRESSMHRKYLDCIRVAPVALPRA